VPAVPLLPPLPGVVVDAPLLQEATPKRNRPADARRMRFITRASR
jgi:hypothetical protein